MVVQERALIWKEDWGGYCIPHFTPTLHSSSLILFHLYPFFYFSKEKTNRFTCKQLLQAKRPLGLMFWTSDGYLRSCSRLDKVLIFFSVFLLTPLPLSLSLSLNSSSEGTAGDVPIKHVPQGLLLQLAPLTSHIHPYGI